MLGQKIFKSGLYCAGRFAALAVLDFLAISLGVSVGASRKMLIKHSSNFVWRLTLEGIIEAWYAIK
jgi:hypothetical protein